MKVDLFSINADNSTSIEAQNVTLESCFPDDPEDARNVELAILLRGVAYYGGGAAPTFKFVRSRT